MCIGDGNPVGFSVDIIGSFHPWSIHIHVMTYGITLREGNKSVINSAEHGE